MSQDYIRENLKMLKEMHHIKTGELAKMTGYHEATVNNHLYGRTNFKVETLEKYAGVFNVTVKDLVTKDGDIPLMHTGEMLASFYPYNLAIDIFKLEGSSEIQINLYDVHVPSLLKVLETLTIREQKVIELRYKEKKTLEEISITFSVTRERIRQIQAKALRKLKSPSRSRSFMFVSKDVLIDAQKEASDYKLKCIVLQDKLDKLSAELNKLDSQAYEEMVSEPLHVAIEELELSVRAYNALTRGGIKYVDELICYTFEGITMLRNLGRKSCEEIREKLIERGLDFATDDDVSESENEYSVSDVADCIMKHDKLIRSGIKFDRKEFPVSINVSIVLSNDGRFWYVVLDKINYKRVNRGYWYYGYGDRYDAIIKMLKNQKWRSVQ